MAETVTATQQIQAQDEKTAKKPAARRRSVKSGKSVVTVVKSKRKTTVARAYVKSGNGSIRINGRDIKSMEFQAAKDMIMEPIVISQLARDLLKRASVKVNVSGGGVSSQVQATRSAIAKGIVAFSKSETLKKEYMLYDRTLLVDDPRRVEPKKFKGPKARARFQTSYR